MSGAAPVIESILAEHADEASFLWLQRTSAVHAPNYSPQQFADLDERLAAHIDGLRKAGKRVVIAAWTEGSRERLETSKLDPERDGFRRASAHAGATVHAVKVK